MIDSVRYECGQQVHLRSQMETMQESTINSASAALEELQGSGNVLCTHDGVLLKIASAEHISDLNTSGALSLVEYTQPHRIYVEWHPNENILIAADSQDQEDWALVDTISRRARTTSECRVFNTKPNMESSINSTSERKTRIMRTRLDELAALEVLDRGQTISFLRKDNGRVHSEFFFQHGNADLFVRSMRQLHFIDSASSTRRGAGYVILTTETQKLRRTFAELDIGDIKASRLERESWLPNKVVGFLVNIPDYVQPPFNRGANKTRQGTLLSGERQTSPDNYQIIGLSGSTNSACSSGSQSHGGSIDKSTEDSELENVKEQDVKIINNLRERQLIKRGAPLNAAQWQEFKTWDGRISDSTRVREVIFHGGIEPNLRTEVWQYLLNYQQWSETDIQRADRKKQKTREYYNMKAQWLSMTQTQEANFNGYRDRKCQIDKDVKRTDRTQEFFAGENNPNLMLLQGILMTYVMYNFDLGYVQGMSDLLAPILEIQGNEVDAFWCFVGFMNLVYTNFDMDQAGMKVQFAQLRRLLEFANPRLFNYMRAHDSDNMYFCFRWLLVWYKRELNNDDVLKLWECFWTQLPCPNFHLLFSVAILDQQTDIIIESNYEFTEILKHVNELAGNIDVQHTLEIAEAIYRQIKSADALPNDIRQIIGEPLLATPYEHSILNPTIGTVGVCAADSDDDFDEIVRELTPEEKLRQQDLLEEACERSMFLQYV